MSNEHLEEVRDFQKSQLDAFAQATLTATDYIAELTKVHFNTVREIIKLLQSHSNEILSAKDITTFTDTNRRLISSLVANSVKCSQDLFATGNQYVQKAKEQATTAVTDNANKAEEVGQTLQQAFVEGAQKLNHGGDRAQL